MSLRPALAGPPLPRPQEAGPCDLMISEAQAPQLLLVTSTMDFQRAGLRLQVVLGHLNRPSAPAIVSFGLPGGTGEGVRLERASPPWWWLPGRRRATAPAALLGSPWGSGEEAAFPCSVTSSPLPPIPRGPCPGGRCVRLCRAWVTGARPRLLSAVVVSCFV